MKFSEVENRPTFTLELSLVEAIKLYKLVSEASNEDFRWAHEFECSMRSFASNSNSYISMLSELEKGDLGL